VQEKEIIHLKTTIFNILSYVWGTR
jgi:hypothetical protein